MTSVHECISDINAYLDIVIENTNKYRDCGWSGIVIKTTSGGETRAFDDIVNIDKAATKYIEIIDNRNTPK